ncbi:MAG: 23S rRNA (adenine(2503)-C(2))-methyltransferase RlmN [Anaerolineae bacterium]
MALKLIPKISILSETQKTFAEKIFAYFGKGKRHASLLYSQWFRKGHLEGLRERCEPQAQALLDQILLLTDFSFAEPSSLKQEGQTWKFLLKSADGLETESVLIPMEAGPTLCVSSQIGCRMGCAFCETGRMGLIRHLRAKEIVAQLFYARFCLKQPVRNIVFMGMGEPLDNFEEVIQAIRIFAEPKGFGFGLRHITLSTSGDVPAIYRFIEEASPAVNLAVSVNAPNDEIRNRLMPVNRRWDMQALKEAMQVYCSRLQREILIEYVLIKDVNDSKACAEQLADYLKGINVKVNLIAYNPQSKDRFSPPSFQAIEEFLRCLRERGIQALLRYPKGQGIMAACGQLGNVKLRGELSRKKTAIN